MERLMDLSINCDNYLDSFDHITTYHLDKYKKNKLNLFVLKTNANEFDYNNFIKNLIEPLIDYSISRKIREEYKNKPGELSKKARQKFIHHLKNKGELGELLLYCFLESHLNAPKIISKLELKTSTSDYVKGSDGVHLLKLENGNYQLIFGESKLYKNLTSGLTNAFKSIYEFKNGINEKGDKKSGLPYEKILISDHLDKETFSKEDKEFIKSIIIPKKDSTFDIDDAFGIFIGYDLKIEGDEKKLPPEMFREKIHEEIEAELKKKNNHILKKIDFYELEGHNFYIYILPFTDLEKTCKKIQKEITS